MKLLFKVRISHMSIPILYSKLDIGYRVSSQAQKGEILNKINNIYRLLGHYYENII